MDISVDSSGIMEEGEQHDFWQHLELQTLIAWAMYSNVASGSNRSMEIL